MKHPLLTAAIVLAIISMSSCGSQVPGQGQSVSNGTTSSAQPSHYVLTATTNSGAVQDVTATSEIEFPLTLQGIANASGHRRAVLQIGSISCAYVADDTSAYIRQDGSCNTFTPNAAVSVNAGDKLTLCIESVDSNNYTSVQADLQAFISN